MQNKALIVEDHPIITESLTRLVTESGTGLQCIHANTGKKGLASLNGNHIDIVLLDIHLPDMNGIEFCTTAKSRFPNLRILAITSQTQRFIIEQMMNCGADGFVLKTSGSDEIMEAIKQVLSGNRYWGKGVMDLINNKKNPSSDFPVLTRRETEVLQYISDGMTNQEIADKLFISCSTVDSHRKNLLLKFNAKNTAFLIKMAVSKGLIS